MGVRVKRFAEFGVTLNVFSGAIASELLTQLIGELEPAEAGNWINYLDPTVDLSGLDLAHIPVLKRSLIRRLTELHGDMRIRSALMTASPANELFIEFWPSYVGRDARYPAEPVSFRTVEAACAWLGLPEAATEAVAQTALR